jgi:septum formation protein
VSRLILASRSPARARLLAAAGVEVELRPADVDEGALKGERLALGETPGEIALALAERKAGAVQTAAHAHVIGADQTLELDGALLDKPATLADARDQLVKLRGRVHQLHSAVVVAQAGAPVWRTVDSVTLQVRNFSDAFLEAYLGREGEALLGCVGAYRLEGLGAQLFERVEGDYFSVLGLPLLPLLGFLRSTRQVDA